MTMLKSCQEVLVYFIYSKIIAKQHDAEIHTESQ